MERKILVASPDAAFGATTAKFLASEGFDPEQCADAQGVLRVVGRRDFSVIVLDLDLADEADVDLVSFIRHQRPGAQLILIFDESHVDRAVEGIRQGAYFYLPKSCGPSDVAMIVRKAMNTLRADAVVEEFERNVFDELMGGSPAMKRVSELISKVAPTDSTVLLLGESGTGKEVLANAVHRLSPRRDKPFVAINCAALPEALLESEMFGHVKGAFTGATSDKEGLFETADGGTILLDEVGDMPLTVQAKLLRVLQNGEIRRVGSTSPGTVDVRVIASTNINLMKAVKEKTFREDLYYRLNVFQIVIPPLRERMDALDVLVGHFIRRFSTRYGKEVREVDDRAEVILRTYHYPGNVRELESIIAHAVILSDDGVIREKDLPDYVRFGVVERPALPNLQEDRVLTMSEIEAGHIRRALAKLDGNQTEAAKQLGMSRSTLWRKMKEYNIPSTV